MFGKNLGDRIAGRIRLAIGLVCGALVVVGIWGLTTRVVGEHVTDCGFDAHGAYAKVRVNNLLGGGHDQTVRVDFSLRNDDFYDGGVATAHVAAHGYGTAVVRVPFPPHDIYRSLTSADSNIEGRMVYRWTNRHPPYDWRFVTKSVAEKHPRTTSIETVPDNPSILHCSIEREQGGD